MYSATLKTLTILLSLVEVPLQVSLAQTLDLLPDETLQLFFALGFVSVYLEIQVLVLAVQEVARYYVFCSADLCYSEVGLVEGKVATRL